MKFELKPTTVRAAIIGAVLAVVVALMTRVPFIDRIAGLLILVLALGIGAYSAMLARQAGNTSGEPAQDAIDGGIASAIAAVFGAVVSVILGVLSGVSQVSSAADAGILAICLGGGVLFAACGSIVFGAVLGAVGGLGYGLYKKNQSGASAGGPPVPPPPAPPPTA